MLGTLHTNVSYCNAIIDIQNVFYSMVATRLEMNKTTKAKCPNLLIKAPTNFMASHFPESEKHPSFGRNKSVPSFLKLQ